MIESTSASPATLPDEEFRYRFRQFLQEHYPQEWRVPIILRLRGEQEKRWIRLLHDHGWRLPAWPVAHGGMGASLAKQLIYHEEMARHNSARFLDSGGTMLGPVLINYGTAGQQREHLPKILRGETLWCQGYSEPNAGSDLASLKTNAVLDGEDYVVNGSKIWTTMAMDASHMFLLVRTNKGGRKQQGISFLLMPMDSPGVTVRPIPNLAGETEFAQVFFDNVRIPVKNRVGEEGQGWDIAKSLLGDERIFVGSPSIPVSAYEIFNKLRTAFAMGDEYAEGLAAEFFCQVNDLAALYEMISAGAIAGIAEEHDFSVMKLAMSELFQRICEASMQMAMENSGFHGPISIGGENLDLHTVFMLSRPATIYSGTSEVQREIIARALLGKPVRSPVP